MNVRSSLEGLYIVFLSLRIQDRKIFHLPQYSILSALEVTHRLSRKKGRKLIICSSGLVFSLPLAPPTYHYPGKLHRTRSSGDGREKGGGGSVHMGV